jgi:photosystem II stability/assembly factor-like uncharacterized protein
MDLLKVPALQSKSAAKSMLLAVDKAGARLVAAGERGIVVYSDDQGLNWTQAQVPVSVTLTTLSFVSPNVGWAAGHDGVILHTRDGGATWSLQFDGNAANTLMLRGLQDRVSAARGALSAAVGKDKEAQAAALESSQAALDDASANAGFGPALPLLGLWFRDAAEGLAVGAFGQMFHTADGGKTWQSWGARIANSEGFHYNSISQAADGTLLIAGEAGKVRRSKDSGQTWETLDTGYGGHLYGVLAIPDTPVLVTYGFSGNILVSGDRGMTWRQGPKLTSKPIVGGMVMADRAIVLTTQDGYQLLSHDQGKTFARIGKPSVRPVAAVLPRLVNRNQMLVVGTAGTAFQTIDTTKQFAAP